MLEQFKTTPLFHPANIARKTLLDPYYWRIARTEYMQKLDKANVVEDAIEQLWRFKGAGYYNKLRPFQSKYELTKLAKRVQVLRPQVVVEIGTAFGGTLYTWSRCSDQLRLLLSIDLPGGIHGAGYPIQRSKLYKLFTANLPQCRLELLREDSHQQATQRRVAELLGDRAIDFLFIDADHRYAGVKRDYELYSPLVRSGGLIAFHDIRPNPDQPSIEVFRLWDEIVAAGGKTEEIIEEPYRGHYGIGLLTKSCNQ